MMLGPDIAPLPPERGERLVKPSAGAALADLRGDLRVLKWSTSATLALVIGIFVKLFIHG
jgi:hypothetical protein